MDEIESDIRVLLDSLTLFTNDISGRCQTLKALADICSQEEGAKAFWNCRAIRPVLEVFLSSCDKEVQRNALFTLASAVEQYEPSKKLLCLPRLFLKINELLKSATNVTLPSKHGSTAAYFIMCITNNYDPAKDIARTSGCIASLVRLYRICAEKIKAAAPDSNNIDAHISFTATIGTTLISTISPPINVSNQIACRESIPTCISLLQNTKASSVLIAALRLIMECVEKNERCQRSLVMVNGLKTICKFINENLQLQTFDCSVKQYAVACLSAAIDGNDNAKIIIGKEGLIGLLIKRLSGFPQFNDEHISTLLVCLSRCIEGNKNNKGEAIKNNIIPNLIQLMSNVQDDKLSRIALYVLNSCTDLTTEHFDINQQTKTAADKEAIKMNDMSSNTLLASLFGKLNTSSNFKSAITSLCSAATKCHVDEVSKQDGVENDGKTVGTCGSHKKEDNKESKMIKKLQEDISDMKYGFNAIKSMIQSGSNTIPCTPQSKRSFASSRMSIRSTRSLRSRKQESRQKIISGFSESGSCVFKVPKRHKKRIHHSMNRTESCSSGSIYSSKSGKFGQTSARTPRYSYGLVDEQRLSHQSSTCHAQRRLFNPRSLDKQIMLSDSISEIDENSSNSKTPIRNREYVNSSIKSMPEVSVEKNTSSVISYRQFQSPLRISTLHTSHQQNPYAIAKPDEFTKCLGCYPFSRFPLLVINSRNCRSILENDPYTCRFHGSLMDDCYNQTPLTCAEHLSSDGSSTETASTEDPFEFRSEAERTPETVYSLERAQSNYQPETRKRKRREYSDEEIYNLLDGVKRFGKRWLWILRSYEFKQGRTAENLKDKYKQLAKKKKS